MNSSKTAVSTHFVCQTT